MRFSLLPHGVFLGGLVDLVDLEFFFFFFNCPSSIRGRLSSSCDKTGRSHEQTRNVRIRTSMVAMMSSPAKAREWLWNNRGSPPSLKSISKLWASVTSQKCSRDCHAMPGHMERGGRGVERGVEISDNWCGKVVIVVVISMEVSSLYLS